MDANIGSGDENTIPIWSADGAAQPLKSSGIEIINGDEIHEASIDADNNEISNLELGDQVTGNLVDLEDLPQFPQPYPGPLILQRNAANTGFEWIQTPTGDNSPLTTKGDLYGFGTANARIPVGANGQVLTADDSVPLGVKWDTAGNGDVSGPISSTTHAIPVYADTLGKTIAQQPGTTQVTIGESTMDMHNKGIGNANLIGFNTAFTTAINHGITGPNGNLHYYSNGATSLHNFYVENSLKFSVESAYNQSHQAFAMFSTANAPTITLPDGSMWYNTTLNTWQGRSNGQDVVIPNGTGFVKGPSLSVGNSLVLFDGATGLLIKSQTNSPTLDSPMGMMDMKNLILSQIQRLAFSVAPGDHNEPSIYINNTSNIYQAGTEKIHEFRAEATVYSQLTHEKAQFNLPVYYYPQSGTPTNPQNGWMWFQGADGFFFRQGNANYPLGDVTGPDTSTENGITRFNGADGKIIQNSQVLIDDDNNMTIPGTIIFTEKTSSVAGSNTYIAYAHSGDIQLNAIDDKGVRLNVNGNDEYYFTKDIFDIDKNAINQASVIQFTPHAYTYQPEDGQTHIAVKAPNHLAFNLPSNWQHRFTWNGAAASIVFHDGVISVPKINNLENLTLEAGDGSTKRDLLLRATSDNGTGGIGLSTFLTMSGTDNRITASKQAVFNEDVTFNSMVYVNADIDIESHKIKNIIELDFFKHIDTNSARIYVDVLGNTLNIQVPKISTNDTLLPILMNAVVVPGTTDEYVHMRLPPAQLDGVYDVLFTTNTDFVDGGAGLINNARQLTFSNYAPSGGAEYGLINHVRTLSFSNTFGEINQLRELTFSNIAAVANDLRTLNFSPDEATINNLRTLSFSPAYAHIRHLHVVENNQATGTNPLTSFFTLTHAEKPILSIYEDAIRIVTHDPTAVPADYTSSITIGVTGSILGFFGKDPVAQPQPNYNDTDLVHPGSGSYILSDSRSKGAIGPSQYTFSNVITALKQLGALRM